MSNKQLIVITLLASVLVHHRCQASIDGGLQAEVWKQAGSGQATNDLGGQVILAAHNQQRQQREQNGRPLINGNHATYVEPPPDFKPIIYEPERQTSPVVFGAASLDQQVATSNAVSFSSTTDLESLDSPNQLQSMAQQQQQQQQQHHSKAFRPAQVAQHQQQGDKIETAAEEAEQMAPLKPSIGRWSDWTDMSIEPDLASSDTQISAEVVQLQHKYQASQPKPQQVVGQALRTRYSNAGQAKPQVLSFSGQQRQQVTPLQAYMPILTSQHPLNRNGILSKQQNSMRRLVVPQQQQVIKFDHHLLAGATAPVAGAATEPAEGAFIRENLVVKSLLPPIQPLVVSSMGNLISIQAPQAPFAQAPAYLQPGQAPFHFVMAAANHPAQMMPVGDFNTRSQLQQSFSPITPSLGRLDLLNRRRKSKLATGAEVRNLAKASHQPLVLAGGRGGLSDQRLKLVDPQVRVFVVGQQRKPNSTATTTTTTATATAVTRTTQTPPRRVLKRRRIKSQLPVGLTSWFLGGIRDLDGRHWQLPSEVINKLAINDVDLQHEQPIASVGSGVQAGDTHQSEQPAPNHQQVETQGPAAPQRAAPSGANTSPR